MKTILPEKELIEKLIENIKVRTCFVTTMERSLKMESDNPFPPPPDVKYYTTRTFEIPGSIREKAFEILWQRDNDNLSISTMILDALIKVNLNLNEDHLNLSVNKFYIYYDTYF
jgi:actin-related protein 10